MRQISCQKVVDSGWTIIKKNKRMDNNHYNSPHVSGILYSPDSIIKGLAINSFIHKDPAEDH